MSEPSEEAEEAFCKTFGRFPAYVADKPWMRGYDAATAKLREELRCIEIALEGLHEKDGLNIPLPLPRRAYLLASEIAKLREELTKAYAERDAAYSLARCNDLELDEEIAKLREELELCRFDLAEAKAKQVIQALLPVGPAQQKGNKQ